MIKIFKQNWILFGSVTFLLLVLMLSQSDFLKPIVINDSNELNTNNIEHPILMPTEDNNVNIYSIVSNIHSRDYQSQYGPLVKSLQGSSIPIHFKLDANNHLVITKSIKQFIEYFLSANAEESIDLITNRIEEIIKLQLPEPAQSEALNVVAQYLDYKHALIQVESQLSDDMAVQQDKHNYQSMFQYRRELRQNNLSPAVYSAFFEEEDQRDEYTAKMIEVKRDHSINPEEKATLLLAAESLLPENERHLLEQGRIKQDIKNEVAKALEQGATEADIYEIRSQAYDHDTVIRFSEADKKKQLWNDRYQEYTIKKMVILNSEGLSENDKVSEIATLRNDHFSSQEQIRINTLDRMSGLN